MKLTWWLYPGIHETARMRSHSSAGSQGSDDTLRDRTEPLPGTWWQSYAYFSTEDDGNPRAAVLASEVE